MMKKKYVRISIAISLVAFAVACNSGGKKESSSKDNSECVLPAFPFPPPEPSAQINLPDGFFDDCETLGDVDEVLASALMNCGYEQPRYYSVPNGFVLITQIEQIELDGTPDYEYRWIRENAPAFKKGFSLGEYFKILFEQNPGYYRCFAFLISDVVTGNSDQEVTVNEIQQWMNTGCNALPGYVKEGRINSDYYFNCLVYEYAKDGNAGIEEQVRPSKKSCKEHLMKAKIWYELAEL